MKTLKTISKMTTLLELTEYQPICINDMIKEFKKLSPHTIIKITIDVIVEDEEMREVELIAEILSYRGYNPEDIYIKKNLFKGLKVVLDKTITKRESMILKLKHGLEGNVEHKNYEIAKKLNISPTAVSHAIRRVMFKLQHPRRIKIIENPDKYFKNNMSRY